MSQPSQTPVSEYPSDMRKNVASNIAEQRRKAGMTQLDVGRILGLEKETVCRIESGKISVTIDRLQEFSNIFQCSFHDLLFDENQERHALTSVITQILNDLSEEERKSVLRIMTETVGLFAYRSSNKGL
jgi:transcriptional regulator with XRE-family HTH domain